MACSLYVLRRVAAHTFGFQDGLILDVRRGEYASLDEEDPDAQKYDGKSHDQKGYDYE